MNNKKPRKTKGLRGIESSEQKKEPEY